MTMSPVNESAKSNIAICTLFEGNYHYGLGGLVNSLYHHGFRGVVWAGYRGSLPPWATPLNDCDGYREFAVGDGLVIRFVLVESAIHFTNFKPQFMINVFLKYDPAVDSLFYFDPDIVIKCRWSFYEEWVGFGVTLVQDNTNSYMPSNHPIRMKWKQQLQRLGLPVTREVNQYFNAGFVGLNRNWINSLVIWKELIDSVENTEILQGILTGDRTSPVYAPDQDSLNMMVMSTDAPISTIGPEGMDLAPGGFTMSHATGPKPWNKKMLLSALKGTAPRLADKTYWNYAEKPIVMFSESRLTMQKIDIALGAAVGRVIRRS
jgi:hypothetical protein